MIVFMLIVLGLCFGSFVEATSWRLHEQSKSKKQSKKERDDLSIVHGRSMCAHCKHQLAWYDLLPLVSWLSLRGKCRYCRAQIGWQAPLLEIATAGLFVFSYVYWPYQLATTLSSGWLLFATWLGLTIGFVLLAVYDLRWGLLPDRVVRPMQALAAVYAVLTAVVLAQGWAGLLQASLAVLVIGGMFWLLFQVSKGEWIGGGDVKLAVVLGLVAGTPLKASLVIFISSLLGSLVGIPVMVVSKQGRRTKIPFGPFLIAATIIVCLFGVSLIDWYRRQFLGF